MVSLTLNYIQDDIFLIVNTGGVIVNNSLATSDIPNSYFLLTVAICYTLFMCYSMQFFLKGLKYANNVSIFIKTPWMIIFFHNQIDT